MTHVIWVHGIGNHTAGYSDPWRIAFDRYLKLPLDAYVEVLWETVFDAPSRTRSKARTRSTGADATTVLTDRERADEVAVREELQAILVARESASRAGATPATRARGQVASDGA